MRDTTTLRRRAEAALGWPEGASSGLSLPALRDLVKCKSEKLFQLMDDEIRSGRVIVGEASHG